MVVRPDGLGAFQFAVLAGLRAKQLAQGCTPRVDPGHAIATTALMEVAEGKVAADGAAAVVLAGTPL